MFGQQGQDTFRVGRFGQVMIEPGRTGCRPVMVPPIAAHRDQQALTRSGSRLLTQIPRHLKPVKARQTDVQQHSLRCVITHALKRLNAVIRATHPIALELQQQRHASGCIHIVIDHQHAIRRPALTVGWPAGQRPVGGVGNHSTSPVAREFGGSGSTRPPSIAINRPANRDATVA